MKNYVLLFFVVTNVVSFNSFSQASKPENKLKQEKTQVVFDKPVSDASPIIAYHVEEKINMKFGGRTSSYTVPDVNLINTNDLGPENIRVVTPKYGKSKLTPLESDLPKASVKSADNNFVKPIKIDTAVDSKKAKYVSLNVVDTYERLINKGYKSADMFKKVADKAYFENNLVEATKWYCELFEITTDLEAVYYYRYAQSLLSTHDTAKAREMMDIFESKK
jgi:hypothetical protein